jgi:hypothetical protein
MSTLQQVTPMTEGQADTVTVGRYTLTVQCVRPGAAYTVTVYQGTYRVDEQCGSYPNQEQAYTVRNGYSEMYRHDNGECTCNRHDRARPATTLPAERTAPRRTRDARAAGERDAKRMATLLAASESAQLVDRLAYTGAFLRTLADAIDKACPDGSRTAPALSALGVFQLAFDRAIVELGSGAHVEITPYDDLVGKARELVEANAAQLAAESARRDETAWHPGWCDHRTTPCEGYHAGQGYKVPAIDSPGHHTSVAPVCETLGVAPVMWAVEVTTGDPGTEDASMVWVTPDDADRLAGALIHAAQRVREAQDAATAGVVASA